MPFLAKFFVVCLALVSIFFFVNVRSVSSFATAQNNNWEYKVEHSYTCRMETRAHEKFLHEMSWPVLGIVVDTHVLYRGGPLSWGTRLYERGVIPLDLDVPAYFTRSNTTLEFNYFERIWGNHESPTGGINLVVVPYKEWEATSNIVVSPTPLKEHDFIIRVNLLDLYFSLVTGSRLVQFCY